MKVKHRQKGRVPRLFWTCIDSPNNLKSPQNRRLFVLDMLYDCILKMLLCKKVETISCSSLWIFTHLDGTAKSGIRLSHAGLPAGL